MGKIENEIVDIQTKLLPYSELEVYKDNLLNLENFTEIHNRDVIKGKEKKYQRDAMAFSMGKAYKWEKQNKDQVLPRNNDSDCPRNDNTLPTSVSTITDQTTLL